MASVLNASPGKLDSLVGLSVPVTDFPGDYTGLTIQSSTTSGSYAATTVTTLNGTDTGSVGPGSTAGETVSVVAVNDTLNSLTLDTGNNGQVQQSTMYVLGYGPDSILLSSTSPISDAIVLSRVNNSPVVGRTLDVLSDTPIAQGTALTFTGAGNTSVSSPSLTVADTVTGQPLPGAAQPYAGPVSGVQEQYINITPDSLNIAVSTPNWFLHSGGGNDAITASSGTNVLDGGTGSNFLTGGSGTDTFFVDNRGATAAIWSTVNNFHAGDAATIWGVAPGDFSLAWVDGQGATGYTGLTLHATATGKPTVSLTLAGFTSTDLNDGRLSVSYGTSGGSAYMYVHANS